MADIALVKLTHPIQYADDVAPICLPEGKMITEDFSGRRGVALGWGRTETKRKAPRRLYRIKLPLMTDSSCRNIYRRFYIPKMMMCTDSKKDAAICYGMIFTYKTLQSMLTDLRTLLWLFFKFAQDRMSETFACAFHISGSLVDCRVLSTFEWFLYCRWFRWVKKYTPCSE